MHELRAAVADRPGAVAEIALALGHAQINIVDMALTPSPDFTHVAHRVGFFRDGR